MTSHGGGVRDGTGGGGAYETTWVEGDEDQTSGRVAFPTPPICPRPTNTPEQSSNRARDRPPMVPADSHIVDGPGRYVPPVGQVRDCPSSMVLIACPVAFSAGRPWWPCEARLGGVSCRGRE